MTRSSLSHRLFLTGSAVAATTAFSLPGLLLAQAKNKLGLSPEDQKKRDELLRSAQTNELIAYISIGVAILLLVIGVSLSIYLDRRKKARLKAPEPGSSADTSQPPA